MKDLKEKKILLIEDHPKIRLVVSKIVSDLGYQVICLDSYAEGLALLLREQFSLVIIESSPVERPPFKQEWINASKEGLDGTSLLPIIIYILKSLSRIPEFIFLSREILRKEFVYAIKNGAVAFIHIPVKRKNDSIESLNEKINERLVDAIKHAANIANGSIFERLNLKGIVYESWSMKRVLLDLIVASHNDENLIISGEPGTGKRAFANSIHNNSNRKHLGFLVCDFKDVHYNVNVPTKNYYPWLFFKIKDSTTTDYGTFYMHCIDYIPDSFLLRLWNDMRAKNENLVFGQPRPYRYIYSFENDPNDLSPFRQTLYALYALSTIHLPRLAERKEDIAGIAKLELSAMCHNIFKENVTMSPDFIRSLKSYDWPGNLLELSEILQYAVDKIGKNETFEVKHLPEHLQPLGAKQQIHDSATSVSEPIKSILKMLNPSGMQLSIEDMLVENRENNKEQMDTDEKSQVNEKPIKDSRRDDNKVESRETCYFYEDGEYWKIGTKSNNRSFEDSKGLKFLHFLIKHPNKDLPSDIVYHEGAETKPYENFKDSPRDRYFDRIQKMNITELEEKLHQLESMENESDELEDQIQRKEYIAHMRQTLKKTKSIIEASKNDQKSRINVTKNIRRAIEKITKKIPEMKKYLDVHTIKTGYIMRYECSEFDTPEWILNKSELLQK